MSGAHTFDRFHTLAPWTQIVPGVGPMTIDDLLALPDDGWQYELVEGALVRVAGSGERGSSIGAAILIALGAYTRPRRLGVVTRADGVYTFPNARNGLVPDVGFYVTARRALIADRAKPIPFSPDLAVEVASPSQGADEMAAKARIYPRGGTRLVWIVWPERQQIDVWRAGDTAPGATLGLGDSLDGEDVAPGFTLLVADVFADPLD